MNGILSTVARHARDPVTALLRPLGFDRNDLRLGVNFARIMLRDRFLGSTLGRVWAVLNPALMMVLFCFVFGVVFKSKLPGSDRKSVV